MTEQRGDAVVLWLLCELVSGLNRKLEDRIGKCKMMLLLKDIMNRLVPFMFIIDGKY